MVAIDTTHIPFSPQKPITLSRQNLSLLDPISPMAIDLSAYGIHDKYGFLPMDPLPIKRLPVYFEPWERILDSLNPLLVAGQLRDRIHKLPLMDVDSHLSTQREYERAYMVLSFLAHSYLIGIPKADELNPVIPATIAVPWVQVSRILSLKPVITYAAVDLYNWFLLDESKPVDLSNLGMQHTFSGVFDEAWFYLIPLAIEAAGGECPRLILEIHQYIQDVMSAKNTISPAQVNEIVLRLDKMASAIQTMKGLLKRMYEKNDPHIFWNRVRPFFGGSKNSATLPHGVFYEGVTEVDGYVNVNGPPVQGKTGTWRKYVGASAGQSPLIHTLDVAFEIHHQVVSSSVKSGSSGHALAKENPMLEMREYLSKRHAVFLVHLQSLKPSIRSFISNHSEDAPSLTDAFDRVILAMKEFRDAHIQLTTLFIVLQQKKDKERQGGSLVSEEGVVGTGGTDLIPFLKQTRKETVDAMISKQVKTSVVMPSPNVSP